MAKQSPLRSTLLAAAAIVVAACSNASSEADELTEPEPGVLEAPELDPGLGTGDERAGGIAASSAALLGKCNTRGCGGIVTNHARSYIRIANCYKTGDGPIAENDLSCAQNADAADGSSFWLAPKNSSANYSDYYDTDTFLAFGGCKTTINKWVKGTPILLGRWVYDRRNLGGQWIKLNDATFVDILSIECQATPPAPPAPVPPPPPAPKLGQIKVLSSKMCLVARAGAGERPVVQVPCASYSDQVWSIEYLDATGPEGVAQLKNRDRGLCLATRGSGESAAVVTTCGTQWNDQLWNIVRDANTGYYQFVNINSKLCLVVRGGSAETQAVQSTCGTQWADQLWIWEGWFN